MKPGLAILLIIGFITAAFFSFASLSCIGAGQCCLAKVINGRDCPPGNPLTHIDFHLTTFRILANAAFGKSLLGAMFVLLVIASTLYRSAHENLSGATPSFLLNFYRPIPPPRISQPKIFRWLARLEKRDPTAHG